MKLNIVFMCCLRGLMPGLSLQACQQCLSWSFPPTKCYLSICEAHNLSTRTELLFFTKPVVTTACTVAYNLESFYVFLASLTGWAEKHAFNQSTFHQILVKDQNSSWSNLWLINTSSCLLFKSSMRCFLSLSFYLKLTDQINEIKDDHWLAVDLLSGIKFE